MGLVNYECMCAGAASGRVGSGTAVSCSSCWFCASADLTQEEQVSSLFLSFILFAVTAKYLTVLSMIKEGT